METANCVSHGGGSMRRGREALVTARGGVTARLRKIELDRAKAATIRDPIQRRAAEIRLDLEEDRVRQDGAAVLGAVKGFNEAAEIAGVPDSRLREVL